MWLSFSCVMYDLSFGNEPIVQIVTVLSLARFIKLIYARANMFYKCKLVSSFACWLRAPYTGMIEVFAIAAFPPVA